MKSLINTEKLMREVACDNPTHGYTFITTNVAQPKCPICGNLMVKIIRSALTGVIVDTPREK